MSAGQWPLFEEYMSRKMEEERIAGAAVAVSRHGELLFQKGFGVRDLETKEPVTPDTVFGIASVTKSFTAMAVMQLAEEGKLSIEDPVNAYLPEFSLASLEDTSSVCIHHLLSHTTGLAPIRRREELCRLSDHLEYLAGEPHELLGRPGEYFSYCNDTFLLLGLIVERVTGRLFRRHVTSRLLDPLEMNRSTFSLEEVKRLSDVSVPYVKDSDGNGLKRADWPLLGNYEVGGGIRSNVRDLLKYGQLYINGGYCQGENIVSEASLRRMWHPVHKIGRNTYYGYALKSTLGREGMTLVEHGGSQPGVVPLRLCARRGNCRGRLDQCRGCARPGFVARCCSQRPGPSVGAAGERAGIRGICRGAGALCGHLCLRGRQQRTYNLCRRNAASGNGRRTVRASGE